MRDILATFGLMALLALVGLSGRGVQQAQASTDVNVVYLSTYTSRVVVTTGTTIRIDNWDSGTQGFVKSDRIAVQYQVLDKNWDIWCGNASTVSTDTAKNTVGFRWSYRDFISDGANAVVQTWCQADDGAGSAGVVIAVRQLQRF